MAGHMIVFVTNRREKNRETRDDAKLERNNVTRRLAIHPKPIIGYRPTYVSARKAPIIGMKFPAAE